MLSLLLVVHYAVAEEEHGGGNVLEYVHRVKIGGDLFCDYFYPEPNNNETTGEVICDAARHPLLLAMKSLPESMKDRTDKMVSNLCENNPILCMLVEPVPLKHRRPFDLKLTGIVSPVGEQGSLAAKLARDTEVTYQPQVGGVTSFRFVLEPVPLAPDVARAIALGYDDSLVAKVARAMDGVSLK